MDPKVCVPEWPDQIFPTVSFGFSRNGPFGLGRGTLRPPAAHGHSNTSLRTTPGPWGRSGRATLDGGCDTRPLHGRAGTRQRTPTDAPQNRSHTGRVLLCHCAAVRGHSLWSHALRLDPPTHALCMPQPPTLPPPPPTDCANRPPNRNQNPRSDSLDRQAGHTMKLALDTGCTSRVFWVYGSHSPLARREAICSAGGGGGVGTEAHPPV